MQSTVPQSMNSVTPWYAQRWPWLLMLGPALVVVAKQLHHLPGLFAPGRDGGGRLLQAGQGDQPGSAARPRLPAPCRWRSRRATTPPPSQLRGRVTSFGKPLALPLRIGMAHSTQPEKDLALLVQPDADGQFSITLAPLERARWGVTVEGAGREWRLAADWRWLGAAKRGHHGRQGGCAMRQGMMRLVMPVLWPSFLTAALAVGCFFSLFDPESLVGWPPMATYTIGFFGFWILTSLGCMLTCYLLLVPENDNPPF
ncbi:FixH family protein [Massilia sp. H-1]|nr:FixH family protein [Massilia sp. H-1]